MSFTKQSYEEFVITGDFSNVLSTGEKITGTPTVSAIDNSGADVKTTVTDQTTITSNDSQVSVLVRAGSVASSPYKITFNVVTDSTPAHKWELDVSMEIDEI